WAERTRRSCRTRLCAASLGTGRLATDRWYRRIRRDGPVAMLKDHPFIGRRNAMLPRDRS
ncbi:hypothetical protein, partial [Brytella acorum]